MKARHAVSADRVQTVEGVADRQPGAMQENAHISFADVEQCADLAGVELLLAAKNEHRPLRRRQSVDHLFDVLQHASTLDVALRGQVLPEFRDLAPVAATVKRVCQAVATGVIVEEDGASFAAGTAARLVDEDGVYPAGKRTASLEKIDTTEHGDPCVLDDLLGKMPVLDDAGAETEKRGVVTPIKKVESRSIAIHQAQNQSLIIPFDLRHAAPHINPAAISETIIFKVQPHSPASSHSDHAVSVVAGGAVLQRVDCFSGDVHD